MSDSRTEIFARIKSALPAPAERPAHPGFDTEDVISTARLKGGDLWDDFKRNFDNVHGRTMEGVEELADFLKENGHTAGYCDPFWMDRVGNVLTERGLKVETKFDRERYDDYQFGITRASGAIAESGTLILDDGRTSDRLAALAPWVHVAILERDEIVRSIPDAIERFGNSPNIVWATGPSKTADVEGILIEGVHGPGEEIALIL